MLSWKARYMHAPADAVFKSKRMGEHRVGGTFNVGMMCFRFFFNSFLNMELRAKKCQSLIWSLILNQYMPSGK